MAVGMSVEKPLWRALTGYRVLTLAYALFVFGWEFGDYAHPYLGGSYMTVLTVWTCATLPRVSSASRCTKSFLAVDITVAVVGILISPHIDARGLVDPTLPSIWVAGPVLAFAIKGGWRWGATGSVLVGMANIIESGSFTRSTLHNVLLVCVSSIAIGYVVEVARASERTLARALQIEAATRERERLARDIHDSVLQVLAMVQRRGTAIGGEAAELGRMAGQQEVALRSLVSTGVVPAQRPAPEGDGTDAAEPVPVAVTRSVPDEGTGGTAAHPPEGAGASRAADGTAAQSTDGARWPKAGRMQWRKRNPVPEQSDGPETVAQDGEPGHCDLRAMLTPFSGAGVSFAEPGSAVLLPPEAARELSAAVSAALDNVRQHAQGPDGEEAQAWILLEDEPGAVAVTVRDDGQGIAPGRLADAEAEGRMGVVLSIRGRLRELGGSAELVSVPGQGTEVELRVPK